MELKIWYFYKSSICDIYIIKYIYFELNFVIDFNKKIKN
jgi:hypothetical protein